MAKKPAKKPAAKRKPKKAETPSPTWIAVLRLGAEGVKRWNRLTAAQRARGTFAKADLSGSDLSGIKFRGVTAPGVSLAGAKLVKAQLDGSFKQADFTNADLTDADLSRPGADESDFGEANFAGTKLVRTNCTECWFRAATFAGADLTGAKLSHANLNGADFSGATLADVVWDGAWFDDKTKWPAGFVIPGELMWKGNRSDPRLTRTGKRSVATDINGLMARLHAVIDEKRMKRTLDMLKKGKNQIFSEVEPTMVRGIVRSQTEEDLVYSCVLTEDGTYSCATPDMAQCMGLWGEPCKHLLVLVIGLARAGQFDPATADKWICAAKTKNPRWNKTVQNHMAGSLLKYKGAQAGEIDWRPTETIPEDFYAM